MHKAGGGGISRGRLRASRARSPLPRVSEVPGSSPRLPRPPLRLAESSGAAAIGRPPSPPPAALPPGKALAASGTGCAGPGPGFPGAPAALSRRHAAPCAALRALLRPLGGPLPLEGQVTPVVSPGLRSALQGPAGWCSPPCGLGAGAPLLRTEPRPPLRRAEASVSLPERTQRCGCAGRGCKTLG